MRFNLRWLNDYLETDKNYEDLLDAITMCGHEVEESVDLGAGSGKIVIGEIISLEKHPDADNLSLCKVKADAEQPYQIVCGANNIEVGQKVPLATIGAELPGGFKLKPTKIRGVASEGMMCSPQEMGIGHDFDGIWIQPEDSTVGESFDALIDIKITPNRPDALSLAGLARDLAVKVNGKFKLPEVKFQQSEKKTESVARVTIEAKKDCPRYAARVIKGIEIKESPLWLKRRLEFAGLRPINNVVDATNYVMLELGHPLHAFDLNTIKNNQVVIRNAKPGEKMTLLDDSEVKLEETDLLIADEEKALALAGIMGGQSSEVSESTTDILLESAYFNPSTIRRTSKRLMKSTDASYRFERGTDYEKMINALHRAAQLIQQLAGGEILNGAVDAQARLPHRETIVMSIERVNTLLGLSLTGREMSDILTRLGFEIGRTEETEIAVKAPSHRPDIEGEADLAEEIARIHGYEKIEAKVPPMRNKADIPISLHRLTQLVENEFTAMGFNQAISFSFVSPEQNSAAGFSEDGKEIKVLNPLVSEQSVMRRSMVPSMLESVARNINQSVSDIRLFEIGKTYEWVDAEGPEAPENESLDIHTKERTVLCAAIAGVKNGNWHTGSRAYDFYDMKAVADRLIQKLGYTRFVIEPMEDHPHYHPGRSAAVLVKGQRLIWFGEMHPALARKLDIKKRVYLLECPFEGKVMDEPEVPKYKEIPKTPSSKRDLAIVAPKNVTALQLERTIKSASGNLLDSIDVFDVYEGDKIPSGTKSLAFSLAFRDPDPEATLKDNQVNEVIEKIIAQIDNKHGAKIRGAENTELT